MKNTIRVDFENHCLVMDRTFAKKAQDVRSEEYAILQKVRLEYPEYCVKRRSIKRNEHKESYRGLTYRYMEKYNPSYAIRVSTRNFGFNEEKKIKSIPLYAVFCISQDSLDI